MTCPAIRVDSFDLGDAAAGARVRPEKVSTHEHSEKTAPQGPDRVRRRPVRDGAVALGSRRRSEGRPGSEHDPQPQRQPDYGEHGLEYRPFGELSQKNGGGISGKRVILEQKPRGASAADFERVPGQPAAGVLTGDGGEFRLLSVKPGENTDYRARYEQGSQTSTSPISRVDVKVNVGLDRVRKNVKVGKNVVMFGKVSPKPDAGAGQAGHQALQADDHEGRSARRLDVHAHAGAQRRWQVHGLRDLRPRDRPDGLPRQQQQDQAVQRPVRPRLETP